ncbi:MAG: hypothetical protein KC713_10055 [Candidatus Omnitrophica bacterium]|nr:hypothetical protein [Candidatus Omnitrophota bacterium]
MGTEFWETIGMIAAVVMPMFNIPLIKRMVQRKSSQDISVTWTVGVWTCIILMTPAGLVTDDMVFKAFTLVNVVMFSLVVFFVLKYRKRVAQ